MPDTPLNPEAVSSIADVILRHCGGYVDTTRADAERAAKAVLRSLAVAQPVVNSVESIPAKMRLLMWEGGEFEVGEIPDGFVLVGFEMETDRAWSMADKVTINIERREVNDAT